jgi:hypothetical protein
MGYPESVSRVESSAWASFHILGFPKSEFFGLPGCPLIWSEADVTLTVAECPIVGPEQTSRWRGGMSAFRSKAVIDQPLRIDLDL